MFNALFSWLYKGGPVMMPILLLSIIGTTLIIERFKYLKKVNSLFVKNERVVLECYDDKANRFFMVFVGALNVGKMIFNFDSSIQTNARILQKQTYTYDDLIFQKGDELGYFEMGSTIVMIFERDYIDFEASLNQKIKFGDSIATRISSKDS